MRFSQILRESTIVAGTGSPNAPVIAVIYCFSHCKKCVVCFRPHRQKFILFNLFYLMLGYGPANISSSTKPEATNIFQVCNATREELSQRAWIIDKVSTCANK